MNFWSRWWLLWMLQSFKTFSGKNSQLAQRLVTHLNIYKIIWNMILCHKTYLWNFRVRKRRTHEFPLQRNGMAAIPKILKLLNAQDYFSGISHTWTKLQIEEENEHFVLCVWVRLCMWVFIWVCVSVSCLRGKGNNSFQVFVQWNLLNFLKGFSFKILCFSNSQRNINKTKTVIFHCLMILLNDKYYSFVELWLVYFILFF